MSDNNTPTIRVSGCQKENRKGRSAEEYQKQQHNCRWCSRVPETTAATIPEVLEVDKSCSIYIKVIQSH